MWNYTSICVTTYSNRDRGQGGAGAGKLYFSIERSSKSLTETKDAKEVKSELSRYLRGRGLPPKVLK